MPVLETEPRHQNVPQHRNVVDSSLEINDSGGGVSVDSDQQRMTRCFGVLSRNETRDPEKKGVRQQPSDRLHSAGPRLNIAARSRNIMPRIPLLICLFVLPIQKKWTTPR
jgi:hypothetical protein